VIEGGFVLDEERFLHMEVKNNLKFHNKNAVKKNE
jgi:hypothetical protein